MPLREFHGDTDPPSPVIAIYEINDIYDKELAAPVFLKLCYDRPA